MARGETKSVTSNVFFDLYMDIGELRSFGAFRMNIFKGHVALCHYVHDTYG